MKDFIRIFDQTIGKPYCKGLILKMKKQKELWRKQNTLTDTMNVMSLLEHRDKFQQEFEYLGRLFTNATDHYAKTLKLYEWQWPDKYGLESMDMQMFEANKGLSKLHINSHNYITSPRFLSMVLFLDEGDGDINFANLGPVERKPGRLVVFPPHWTLPHEQLIPTTDKYTIQAQIRYVHPDEKI